MYFSERAFVYRLFTHPFIHSLLHSHVSSATLCLSLRLVGTNKMARQLGKSWPIDQPSHPLQIKFANRCYALNVEGGWSNLALRTRMGLRWEKKWLDILTQAVLRCFLFREKVWFCPSTPNLIANRGIFRNGTFILQSGDCQLGKWNNCLEKESRILKLKLST